MNRVSPPRSPRTMTIRTRLARALLLALTAARFLAVTDASAQEASSRPEAPTLAEPASPEMAPDADGFIRRWLILEPIRRPGSLADSAVQAGAPTLRYSNRTVNDTALVWHAVETSRYNVNLYHFAYALDKPTSNVLFWVVTVVEAPTDIPDVRLAICSNAASVWWLNGKEVIGLYNDRQAVIDDGVSKRLTLTKGANVIRAAVINGGGATDFCARFIDEQGNPIRDLTVRLGAG